MSEAVWCDTGVVREVEAGMESYDSVPISVVPVANWTGTPRSTISGGKGVSSLLAASLSVFWCCTQLCNQLTSRKCHRLYYGWGVAIPMFVTIDPRAGDRGTKVVRKIGVSKLGCGDGGV